jgi:hypothetical protein
VDDDRKSMVDRVVEAAELAVARMQQEVAQSPVVSATKERAQAMRDRAQTAVTQLPLATADDVARLQASIDRIEAAVNDIARELRDLRETRPAEPPRGQLSTGMEELGGEGGSDVPPPMGPA